MWDSPIEMVRDAISRLAVGDVAGANWLISAAHDATRSPEMPDATDETRLAAGWRQQVMWSADWRSLEGTPPHAGCTTAPGPAGRWRVLLGGSHHGSAACWWLRWLVPVEVSGG